MYRISGIVTTNSISVEVPMIAALAKTFRGVLCRWCRKPIRVPKKFQNSDDDNAVNEIDLPDQLVSQTFILRCRACQKESIYSVNQINDYGPEGAE
jgi:hypothetical protein